MRTRHADRTPTSIGGLRVGDVHRMDGLEGLARLRGKVDVIVTSPPYNIGKPYSRYDDRRTTEDYLAWMGEAARACAASLRPRGSLFLNLGGKPSDPMAPLRVAQRFGDVLPLQNTIVWVKSIAIPREDIPRTRGISSDLGLGHYQPVHGTAFLNGCFEYVFHYSRTGSVPLDKLAVGVPYQDKSNVSRWAGGRRDRRDRGNTWFIPYETIRETRPHPATFPPKLPEMCLRLHGLERVHLVVDPFMGIGSTGVAAVRCGVPFLGFEVDPSYIALARRRIRSARRSR